jgi:hypothetical protein
MEVSEMAARDLSRGKAATGTQLYSMEGREPAKQQALNSTRWREEASREVL